MEVNDRSIAIKAPGPAGLAGARIDVLIVEEPPEGWHKVGQSGGYDIYMKHGARSGSDYVAVRHGSVVDEQPVCDGRMEEGVREFLEAHCRENGEHLLKIYSVAKPHGRGGVTHAEVDYSFMYKGKVYRTMSLVPISGYSKDSEWQQVEDMTWGQFNADAKYKNWTDVYKEFDRIIWKLEPNWRQIAKEVKKLYEPHRGDPLWDEAYRRWIGN